jgi:3-oxoacyl-[acyl-carrier protein] reductase
MDHTIPKILVTGASRGLGKGIALHLAQSGFSVAINYVSNETAAQQTVEECTSLRLHESQEFVAIKANIREPKDRVSLIQTLVDTWGIPDGLVNNAGIAPRERNDIIHASIQSFEEVLQTNLEGPYFLTQQMAKHWLNEAKPSAIPTGRKIVFITSVSAYTASINRGEYCIAKAGLSMAGQLWAARLAAENIQVYELRPGIMETDMTSGVKSKYDELIEQGFIPQKRWGTPDDMGLAVTSIMKGEFPFSTGSIIDVDGGFRMRIL